MKKRILIVEDERPLAHALDLKLQREGFETVLADNGQAGLDLLLSQHFDGVLLDMMMPVLDGFQMLQQLKEKSTGEIPKIIVLSNLSQREDEHRVLESGAYKYFIKSNTPLSAIIEEVKQL